MGGVYLITDRRRSLGRPVAGLAAEAAAAGVGLIQVREKDLSTRALLELLREVQASVKGAEVLVNDRVDLALAAGCAGVHLGATTLPVAAARKIAPGLRIGYSAHALDEARRAEADGADFVTFSPIFKTDSSGATHLAPQGIVKLAEVCRALGIPVYALGGVSAGRVPALIEAGAAGVAVVSAISEAPDAATAARKLVELARGASPRE